LAAWPAQAELQPPYIVKAIWEHASLGIDDASLVAGSDGGGVLDQISRRRQALRCPCFAEAFIAGREFNLSLLASDAGVQALPPAEIDFSAFPADKPQIVGYAAKWVETAAEYQQTPRRFDFPAEDAELLERLGLLARRSWDALGLQGYARVDFRVAAGGNPYILEVNANPCLSPDAGFAAALARGGITFEQAVERMLRQALVGKDQPEAQAKERPAPSLALQAGIKQKSGIALRTVPRQEDRQAVRAILESTSLFRPGEVDVAEELVEEYLDRGPQSGYCFLFAEADGQTLGYTCFGRDEMTVSSYELYWIAVHRSQHGRGIGRLLLAAAEAAIRAEGGTRLYIETSGRADYVSTRGFYLRCGYDLAALLPEYYAPADGKLVYVKTL
jgi:GNAT superfamily N-acetyltransferase